MNRTQLDNLFKTYKPVQDPDELYWLIRKVEKLNPKTILEIGVQKGATLSIWDNILNETCHSDCLLIGIDIQNRMTWDTRKSKNNIQMLFTDSRKKETTNIMKNILKERKLDFAFIDGGHTEATVTSDYQNYSQLVRKGGLVAFHDVNNRHYPGVKQFWDKVKRKKESCNYCSGIGIIYM